MNRILLSVTTVLWALWIGCASAAEPAMLELEYKVPLGEVKGRIDHLALDVARQRLYVAELGNDSLGVIDLKSRAVLRTISGFNEPQGVGYEPTTDSVYVANAGDGSVRIYQGENWVPTGRIDLGSDADNVRIDAAAHRVYVGHSDGAIAVIDAASQKVVNDIHLKDHPEGFQLDPGGLSIWVNIPDHQEIGVLDRTLGRQVASWPMAQWGGNFPMALQADRGRLAVVFRNPARLAMFDTRTGQVLTSAETCGDSDDVFVDSKRHHLYVSCGDGYIDVFTEAAQGLSRSARLPTIRGARTALYSPELDRLFLAVRASGNSPASVWVFKAAS